MVEGLRGSRKGMSESGGAQSHVELGSAGAETVPSSGDSGQQDGGILVRSVHLEKADDQIIPASSTGPTIYALWQGAMRGEGK